MSQQGTCYSNHIIQTVAEKLSSAAHITKSNPIFAEMNVIHPLHFTEGVQTIHWSHIDELHYIPTVQLDFEPIPVNNNTVLVTSETNSTQAIKREWLEEKI